VGAEAEAVDAAAQLDGNQPPTVRRHGAIATAGGRVRVEQWRRTCPLIDRYNESAKWPATTPTVPAIRDLAPDSIRHSSLDSAALCAPPGFFGDPEGWIGTWTQALAIRPTACSSI
jgi:hypothetical protein